MKKYLGILSAFVLTFILTGCVRYNTTVEVTKTKKVNFSIIYAFDMDMMNGLSDEGGSVDTGISEEDKKEFAEKGFKVSDYKDGSYEGVKLTKSWKNIDDVSSDTDVTYNLEDDIEGEGKNESKMFKVEKGFFKNKYTLKMDGSSEDLNGEGMEQLASSMDLKFTLKLPKKASSNNATTVNKGGKELVWDLTKTTNIEATFEVYNAPFYILIGGIVLVVIIVIIVIIKKGKKGTPVAGEVVTNTMDNSVNGINQFTNNQPAAPVMPQAPTQPQQPDNNGFNNPVM
jgi:hypothetical protein